MTLLDICRSAANARSRSRVADMVFSEAVGLYLHSCREHGMLNRDDLNYQLIAIDTLARLGDYHLARAVIRLVFSRLTMDDYLQRLDQAHAEHAYTFAPDVPF